MWALSKFSHDYVYGPLNLQHISTPMPHILIMMSTPWLSREFSFTLTEPQSCIEYWILHHPIIQPPGLAQSAQQLISGNSELLRTYGLKIKLQAPYHYLASNMYCLGDVATYRDDELHTYGALFELILPQTLDRAGRGRIHHSLMFFTVFYCLLMILAWTIMGPWVWGMKNILRGYAGYLAWGRQIS